VACASWHAAAGGGGQGARGPPKRAGSGGGGSGMGDATWHARPTLERRPLAACRQAHGVTAPSHRPAMRSGAAGATRGARKSPPSPNSQIRWPVVVDLPESTWPITTRLMWFFSLPMVAVPARWARKRRVARHRVAQPARRGRACGARAPAHRGAGAGSAPDVREHEIAWRVTPAHVPQPRPPPPGVRRNRSDAPRGPAAARGGAWGRNRAPIAHVVRRPKPAPRGPARPPPQCHASPLTHCRSRRPRAGGSIADLPAPAGSGAAVGV
jgi:hypothetical protein